MALGSRLLALGGFRLAALGAIGVLAMPGVVSPKARSLEPPRAQSPEPIAESELEAASNGRTIRIGVAKRAAEIPIETYVARVLAGEAEPRAADAAQQALAIAVRTYAAVNLGRHEREGFDLCDTTHCQVMRNSTPASRRAAMATAGQVLMYEGRPAELFYYASCGGRTEAASAVWPGMDYPYLRSVHDDVHGDDKPWVLELTLGEIQQALRRKGFEGRLSGLAVRRHTGSGRVGTVHVRGMRPDEIAGDDFRAALGFMELRSTRFALEKTSTGFRFTGTGFGHGVGMCVIGAGRRAARGETAAEILAVYYPGLTLAKGVDPIAVTAPEVTAAPPPAAPTASAIVVRVPNGSGDRVTVERLAVAAHADLTKAMGVTVAPISVELHASLESFRHATGRPWWVGAVVTGASIDLAPAPVLAQREGLEAALRAAMAETLIGDTFRGRPAWMRVGAARHFARGGRTPSPALASRAQCPTDAELTLAVSAPAQRDAELRAEACFVRAHSKTKDWRQIRG